MVRNVPVCVSIAPSELRRRGRGTRRPRGCAMRKRFPPQDDDLTSELPRSQFSRGKDKREKRPHEAFDSGPTITLGQVPDTRIVWLTCGPCRRRSRGRPARPARRRDGALSARSRSRPRRRRQLLVRRRPSGRPDSVALELTSIHAGHCALSRYGVRPPRQIALFETRRTRGQNWITSSARCASAKRFRRIYLRLQRSRM